MVEENATCSSEKLMLPPSSLLSSLSEIILGVIWNQNIWLGKEYTWKHLESPDATSIYYPRPKDLNLAIVVALVFVCVRDIFDKCMVPVARSLGIHERKRRHLADSPELETAYKTHKGRVPYTQIQSLSKETGMTTRRVQIWMLRRSLQNKPCTMYKFQECSWHVFYYTLSVIAGIWIIWNKPLVWNFEETILEWPRHHVGLDVALYYIIQMGFYLGLVITTVFHHDSKKKDYYQMLIHHAVTVTLIYVSWSVNVVRCGVWVFFTHDVTDPILALAKICKYARRMVLCEVVFYVFIVAWIITRLIIYPYKVIFLPQYAVFLNRAQFYTVPMYWAIVGLLVAILALNTFWTYMIVQMAIRKYASGKIEDNQSESEEEPDVTTDDEVDKEGDDVAEHVATNGNKNNIGSMMRARQI